jgi:polyhydroxyalkanoate synthase
LVLSGSETPVDIGAIDMPLLQVVGTRDHLVPPETSRPFNDRVPSDDTDVFELDSGHVGLAISSAAHDDLWPRVCDWIAAHSTA